MSKSTISLAQARAALSQLPRVSWLARTPSPQAAARLQPTVRHQPLPTTETTSQRCLLVMPASRRVQAVSLPLRQLLLTRTLPVCQPRRKIIAPLPALPQPQMAVIPSPAAYQLRQPMRSAPTKASRVRLCQPPQRALVQLRLPLLQPQCWMWSKALLRQAQWLA